MDKNCRKVAIITDNPGWHGEQLRKSLKGRDLDSVYLSLADCSIEITGDANDIKLPGFEELPFGILYAEYREVVSNKLFLDLIFYMAYMIWV